MSDEKTFFKILIAIDGSQYSKKAAEFALDIIKGTRDKKVIVIGLTVLDLTKLGGTPFVSAGGSSDVKRIREKRKEAEQWLRDVEEMFNGAYSDKENLLFQTDILEDPTSKISPPILNYAERAKVNLIIAGTKGRTGFQKLLLGSVASDLAANAHCPVLVVR